jgi:hypothetical protein
MKRIWLLTVTLSSFLIVKSQIWSPVVMGTNNAVMAFCNDSIHDLLYVGGFFDSTSGIQTNHIAKWDGVSWDSLGSGINGTLVRCIKEFQGGIYACGVFSSAGGISANNIAKWNGTYWEPLQGGVDNQVMSMIVYNNELYVAGDFNNANGNPSSKIAKWDGNNWSSVGNGFNGAISALQVYNGALYAGGGFTMAGGQPSYYIAKWNGTNWLPVGNGLSGSPSSMINFNGKLYISYGTNTVIWDGTYLAAWNNGGAMDNNIMCMLSFNNELYYGGWFTMAGGDSINYITKWNQQGWSSFGSGMNGGVFSMSVYRNDLYAGGWFTMAGGDSINYIAKWNLPVLIEENSVSQNNIFYVYPNPIRKSELLNIHFNNSDFVSFDIYNSIGLSVKSLIINHIIYNSQNVISICSENLPVGIYFVILRNHNKVLTEKIIIY